MVKLILNNLKEIGLQKICYQNFIEVNLGIDLLHLIKCKDKKLKIKSNTFSWIHQDGFYELQTPQMSKEWMHGRRYRVPPSKWEILNRTDALSRLADSICNDYIIDFSKLSLESQDIIRNEDNVRKD